jgi:anti-anti-sigma factor
VNEGRILYAKVDHTYVLKFLGDVRYTIAAPLGAFIRQLQEQSDFDDILIDLTETEGIDSTSLGLLARIANLVQGRFHHKTTLLSTNRNVNHTLATVGFYDVFNIGNHPVVAGTRGRALPPVEDRERETTQAILEAHRTLASLNESNREVFRDVLEALEYDPARREKRGPTLH